MLKGKGRWIDAAILALVPFAAVLLLLLRFHVPATELSIFNSPWNDELSYYKQIEAIVFHGMPRGFFGYNESRALVGTFGPWTPCLLFPYALVFRLVGMGTYRIVFTNLLLASLTLVGCSRLLRFGRKSVIAVSLLFLSCANFARYALSVSPELMVMLGVVWMLSFLLAYERTQEGKHLYAYWALLAFLTLLRGYYAVYALAGVCLARGKARKILTAAVALCSALLYFAVVHFFCSPYFRPLINVDLFRLLVSSPLHFCTSSLVVLRDGLLQTQGFAAAALADGSLVGVFYLLTAVVVLASLLVGAINRNKTAVFSAACLVLLVAALWLLYDVYSGSRHVMASVLALGFIAVDSLCRTHRQGLAVLPLVCAMAFLTYCRETEFEIGPPRADGNVDGAVGNAGFEMAFSENGWDNTVIWTLGCDYRYLYALPAGAGINLCTGDYVVGNAGALKSKYIALQDAHGEWQPLVASENWRLEAEIGPVSVYSTDKDGGGKPWKR